MKKLLLLMLVLLGGVMQVNAAKLYISIENVTWWTNLRVYAANTTSNNGWNDERKGIVSTTTSRLGKTWYAFEMGDYTTAQVQQYGLDNTKAEGSRVIVYNQTYDITVGDEDRYVIIDENSSDSYWDGTRTVYKYGYAYYEAPAFRSNGDYGWGATTNNMTVKDANTVSIDLSKTYVDKISDGDIRFRIYNFGNQLYPNTSGTKVVIAGSGVNDISNSSSSDNYFSIDKPAYNYDYITVTAAYNTSTSKWTVSADAYISKTLNKDYTYATLGSGAKLDLSGLSTEGVTAYRLTADYSTKKITKGDAFSGILDANKGVLLEYSITDNKTLEIPVSASDATSGSNDMVACTTGHIDQVDGDGYTKYILADQDGKVGFYMVNETYGNDMGGYTAYLNVLNTADTNEAGENAARDFFVLEGETTGIANLNVNDNANFNADAPMYNLAGQRVNKSYKGVIIVNGKKMLNK